uniref:Uncharacterized protein n=1 Tax=Trichobilharzia regenti TaxID=157069 RepID=A0AA85JMW7_TRIRE|nr:unnamed protein product [Trichobilharzia regenti]
MTSWPQFQGVNLIESPSFSVLRVPPYSSLHLLLAKGRVCVCDRLPSNEYATESSIKKLLDTNMEIINLCTEMLNIMTTDRKSRQQTYPPANGDLTLQFPIENEDQLEMLEASLRDEKYKQQYTDRQIVPYAFYKIMRSKFH